MQFCTDWQNLKSVATQSVGKAKELPAVSSLRAGEVQKVTTNMKKSLAITIKIILSLGF